MFQHMQKIWILFLVFGLMVLSGAAYLFSGTKNVLAAPHVGDGVDLHVTALGSADNGATWHNYNGTENPQWETLTVAPGATIRFAIFVFGVDQSVAAANVKIEGNVNLTDPTYITGLRVDFPDADLDDNAFIGFTFRGGGEGTVAQVLPGNLNTQILVGTFQLSNYFPLGQTILLGHVDITDYTPIVGGYHPLKNLRQALGIKTARAEGVGRFSDIRIVVNGNGILHGTTQATPTPTPTSTVSPASQITNLPQTGGGILDNLSRFLRLY